MNQQPEYQLQCAVAQYLAVQYPGIPFIMEGLSNVGLRPQQAARLKKLNPNPRFAMPDLFIAKPNGGAHGMFIEFKAKSPFKKNSDELLKNAHNEKQAATMTDLAVTGYVVGFAWEFDQAKHIIDNYLKDAK